MERLETYILAANNPIGKKQRCILKRKRATEELTREQVKAIKAGRKVLRKEMKAQGLKEKSDFELTATNLGLYFDKHRAVLWLGWFFHGRGLMMLLILLGMLLLSLFAYSMVTQLQGHFTINMSEGMFREGFILSETRDFRNPTTHLFATPAEGVPCISITDIPEYVDTIDGQHNSTYFAYTFYCRNEGESTVDYIWQVNLNSESQNLSSACWVMVFEDGKMLFYAEPNTGNGRAEALPPRGDDSRGYVGRPLGAFSKRPGAQYQLIHEGRSFDYIRVIPIPFLSDTVVAEGEQTGVKPGDVHKYTVVMWMEGDDPDCTEDMIGGHIGMDFGFRLIGEAAESHSSLWDSLRFWED